MLWRSVVREQAQLGEGEWEEMRLPLCSDLCCGSGDRA
eukprot:gene12329-biopygen2722